MKYIQNSLSIIAIILSLVALCKSYPRYINLEFDYIGIIVGIFGVLVAILIGWQLFNALNLKEYVEQTENAKESAIQAQKSAEQMMMEIKNDTIELSKKISSLSDEVTHLSNCNKGHIENFSTLTKNFGDLQSIVKSSVDLYQAMQTNIRKLNAELGNKIDKNEFQTMSIDDAKVMAREIVDKNNRES